MERAELNSLVLATGCAEQRGEFVFLRDPKWGPAEQARLRRRSRLPAWRVGKGSAGSACRRVAPAADCVSRVTMNVHSARPCGAFARTLGFST